ncbi:hypothetical protein V1477_010189 [Vespula maculifrons]|uniref:Uncharacterized protein n=3 Tax=Vespula TaxID=7451 RepID=A0A834NUQ1_VESGE|nr:hypothetical protein HZH66_000883 [Vespula vulgaris]KAF7418303.1 hypothetical protein HZH68_000956 [Vespula germanica]
MTIFAISNSAARSYASNGDKSQKRTMGRGRGTSRKCAVPCACVSAYKIGSEKTQNVKQKRRRKMALVIEPSQTKTDKIIQSRPGRKTPEEENHKTGRLARKKDEGQDKK